MRQLSVFLLLAIAVTVLQAETYRCQKGGQTVFSDVPCAAGANRVDVGADQVGRNQKQQAELVRERDRRQLSELEYRAARERSYHGGVYIPSETPANTGSTTIYRRSR